MLFIPTHCTLKQAIIYKHRENGEEILNFLLEESKEYIPISNEQRTQLPSSLSLMFLKPKGLITKEHLFGRKIILLSK